MKDLLKDLHILLVYLKDFEVVRLVEEHYQRPSPSFLLQEAIDKIKEHLKKLKENKSVRYG